MNGRLKKSLNILTMLLLVSVFLVSCTEKQSNTYLSISQDDAVKLMEEEKDFVILDVRRPDEFEQGHIPGAINIPNETIIEDAEGILKDRNQLILVYCRSGNRSKQASEKLADMGYTRIREFGGIIDWKGEIEK